jgi:hypothetical protein
LEVGREIDAAAHRQPAVGAEAVFAAVDRGAARAGGDAGLAQDGDGATLAECAFQRPQLGVDMPDRGQLGEHQRVVALAEAMQVEHEPTEVSVGELTRLAQEPRTATCATARSKARSLGRGRR